MRDVRPWLIVNAAAYTAVDAAEADAATARAINGVAPGVLAEEAALTDAALVHYSTDYVFDGTLGRAYTERDAPAPLNAYGTSKLAGEQAVLAAGGRALVLRTSWVYGAHGHNFARTMLRLASGGGPIRVVDDQWGVPTSSAFLADATLAMVRQLTGDERGKPAGGAWGLHHVVPSGSATWHVFAAAILDGAAARGIARPALHAVSTAEYGAMVRRPAYSVLDASNAVRRFGLSTGHWREQLTDVLDTLLGPVVPEGRASARHGDPRRTSSATLVPER